MTEAEEAAAAWSAGRATLIHERENAVLSLPLPGGGRAALRLHRPGYQSAAAIRSELFWTEALAGAGLPVPRPIRTAAGALLHSLSTGRLASAVSWLPGTPLGRAWEPLSGSVPAQMATFRQVGALLARLHAATDALALPADFTRPSWDAEGLLGEAPLWGRFWENPALTPSESALLQEARGEARRRLAALPAPDFGLIHADLMRENILIDGPVLSLIDFDDSGWGYRGYDLATLMLQNLDEPHWPALLAAAAEGYAALRPLDVAALPMFVALRSFASCGWAVPRLAPGSPHLRHYATRAVAQAKAFLS